MTGIQPALIIFILGVVAAFSGFQSINEVAKKSRPLKALFVIGILTQIFTQYLQYSNAEGNRIQTERNAAFSLFAYTRKDISLLKELAKNNPYLIGYRYLQDKKFDQARAYFDKSIEQNSFVAPSHYLIAHMIRQTKSDWSEAENHLEKAIKYDNKYAAAYYARAIIKIKGNKHASALKDLEETVKYDAGQCKDLLQPTEVSKYWKPIISDPKFKDLQKKCRGV